MPTLATNRRCLTRGFTIIELLVSIAIIAILLSILMPSLGSARHEAAMSKCMSNLRSLMHFTAMYQQESEGEKLWWYRLPTAEGLPEPNLVTPWTFGGFRGQVTPRPDGYDADCSIYPASIRPLNRFAAPDAQDDDVLGVYVCPGDRTWDTAVIGEVTPEAVEEAEEPSWRMNGNSYTLNTRFMQGYTWPPGDFAFTEIEEGGKIYQPLGRYATEIAQYMHGDNAARFVMWTEQGCYSAFYRAGPDLESSQAAPQRRGWHHRFSRWTSAFADGHAGYEYMDTRVAHGPSWTVWDPKHPRGGL